MAGPIALLDSNTLIGGLPRAGKTVPVLTRTPPAHRVRPDNSGGE